MNKFQRAAHYLERIQKSKNPLEEAKDISAELETLVWLNTNQRLTKQEKLEIIEELESLAFSTLRKSERIIEASDNSGILDVISLLKRGVKE